MSPGFLEMRRIFLRCTTLWRSYSSRLCYPERRKGGVMLEAFRSLKIVPLRFRFEAVEEMRLPEYKGAFFRGGFGAFFRDLVCVTREPSCTGCPHVSECPYSLVFDTPVVREHFRVLRNYPYAPHPFVLVPPLDSRQRLPPRTAF